MAIILEGVDCSGKSTFANQLKSTMKSEIIHFKKPDIGFDFYKGYVDIIDNNPFDIFDRFMYSEMVYSKLFRGGNIRVSLKNFIDIESKLLDTNSIIIFMNPDINVIKDRMNKRGDEFINIMQIEEIIKEYKRVLNNSRLPVYEVRGDNGKWL